MQLHPLYLNLLRKYFTGKIFHGLWFNDFHQNREFFALEYLLLLPQWLYTEGRTASESFLSGCDSEITWCHFQPSCLCWFWDWLNAPFCDMWPLSLTWNQLAQTINTSHVLLIMLSHFHDKDSKGNGKWCKINPDNLDTWPSAEGTAGKPRCLLEKFFGYFCLLLTRMWQATLIKCSESIHLCLLVSCTLIREDYWQDISNYAPIHTCMLIIGFLIIGLLNIYNSQPNMWFKWILSMDLLFYFYGQHLKS